jgi:hypothetical protein
MRIGMMGVCGGDIEDLRGGALVVTPGKSVEGALCVSMQFVDGRWVYEISRC